MGHVHPVFASQALAQDIYDVPVVQLSDSLPLPEPDGESSSSGEEEVRVMDLQEEYLAVGDHAATEAGMR